MTTFSRWAGLVLLAAGLLLAGCAGPKAASTSSNASEPTASSEEGDGDLKPFSEVVPDDATTDEGLLTTHRTADKLFFSIPDSLMGRELLLVSRSSRTPDGLGYGGQKVNTHVLRWQKRDDTVMLRVVSYEKTADQNDPVYRAVQNSNFEPIIRSFEVKARTEADDGVVLEVTDLFASDIPALGLPQSVREQYKVRRLDGSRSFVADAKSFPENTDVESVLTYEAKNPPSSESTGTLSLEMNHSFVLLPSEPMTPRHCDDRVGYFSVEHVNYSSEKQKAAAECFITRWRLEPSDPEAYRNGELVEPKEPIVYYIDPATPEKWRPYLKQGIEDWQEAFRAAGFKNAIIAKDPPTAEEDSTFDPDDIRYSVIRYFASDVQNASGPHVHDPRSGEILESDINWYHNVQNLLRNWYFVQTAAANPEARGRTFDEDVMGELIRFVAAHEVGHTLGLPHNWGSSHAVPVDSLRSPSYTSTHGTAPSIMDYARFNYVAQPGDGVENFMPQVGPYDDWSIEFGYRRVADAERPDADADYWDERIREKAGDPTFFYGKQTLTKVDPRSQNEDLTADAVEASRLGIENLKRILPNLITWTRSDGEGYATLEELYGAVLNQWGRYMGHVTNHVGGVYETPKTYAQDGPVYEPVAAAEQQRAVDFLVRQAFQTPRWMLETDVLRRIEHAGAMERIRAAQVDVLEQLLEPRRLARLLEAEAMNPDDAYEMRTLLVDIRDGVWTEVQGGDDVGPFRRNLQRGYLAQMENLMTVEVEEMDIPEAYEDYVQATPVTVAQSDIRALVRSELQTLRTQVERASSRASDPATVSHYDDVLVRIDRILDPTESAE